MRGSSRIGLALPLLIVIGVAASDPSRAADWLPIAPEELTLTSEPKAPGAAAIFLYRQVDRDDTDGEEVVYQRIKILTSDGRKYADVEIPYLKEHESVRDIEARTIRPDGSVLNFTGEIFDKTIIKTRGAKYLAKTFALPDVQVGYIIEYRYRRQLDSNYVFDSRWVLSQELYTKLAKFSLRANERFALTSSWPSGLPADTAPPKDQRGRIRLETHDVPAFIVEDEMPPEDELKYRVDFIYYSDPPGTDADEYWKKFAKERFRDVDDFVDERRSMEQAVAQIVQPGDSDELKLQKIYARTQQIRNRSFERQKTDQEIKRENLKEAHNVTDVWKRGYGDGLQVNWLFLALVRAAGLQADPLYVSTRDRYFFNRRMMNPGQLNTNAVVVRLQDREVYFDPGSVFVPYGVLPWYETGVQALRLSKQGGEWIKTPAPGADASHIERVATLRMSESGSLEGKLTVTFTGQEALWRRVQERDDDETSRRKFLENEVKGFVPAGISVKLLNAPDWNSSTPEMVAEFDLQVPGWAESAGRRTLFAVGLFSGTEKHLFEHAVREQPLYFEFPYRYVDDVTIELPHGWQISNVPAAKSIDKGALVYKVSSESNGTSLHMRRFLEVSAVIVAVKFYDVIRDFYQHLRAGDEEQIVVSRSPAPAKS